MTMQADFQSVVIGGGVIGLAIGQALSRRGQVVLILERNMAIGQETSARSSEVIHAGIYYPKGSLKARLCVEGRSRLYAFAAENGIAVRRTGKLIIATSPQEEVRLAAIAATAAANGVSDLKRITAADVAVLEPHVACTAALLSPSTGIIDSHGLMAALEGHLTSRGGAVVLGTEVRRVTCKRNGLFTVETLNNGMAFNLTATTLVAAAGHGMTELGPLLPRADNYAPPLSFKAKGHYFSLRRRAPFSHLIYPVPVDGGLGIHLTLDLHGQARFGPDVQWLNALDYTFDDPEGERLRAFAASIKRYWPGLSASDLVPGYTGIRPKISGPGMPAGDFAIHGPRQHGIPNMVALYGIESPGLTSALAIGDYVADMVASCTYRT